MQIVAQPNRQNFHSEIPVACVACHAREGGVCGTLSPSQLAEVVRKTARRRVEPQIEIIGQGDGIEHCAAIVRGVVKLSKMLADGRQQIVGLQFAPDFLGTPFLRECSLSAEAVTNVDLCVFPRALIERLAAEAPDLQRRLHVETLKKLCAARDWMLTLGRKTAKERVASFLYLIATRINLEDGTAREFDLPLPRRYRRLSRPDHRDRQPPDHQAAQGGRDPRRKQAPHHRAGYPPADEECQHRLLSASVSVITSGSRPRRHPDRYRAARSRKAKAKADVITRQAA